MRVHSLLLAVTFYGCRAPELPRNHHADHLRAQFDMGNKRLASIAVLATAFIAPVHWLARVQGVLQHTPAKTFRFSDTSNHRQGKGKMPAFGNLSSVQIDDLIAYLKTL